MLKNMKGSFTVESTIVVYISILFILFFFGIYMNNFLFCIFSSNLDFDIKTEKNDLIYKNYKIISDDIENGLLIEKRNILAEKRKLINFKKNGLYHSHNKKIKFIDVFNIYLSGNEIGGKIIEFVKNSKK